MNGKHAGGDGLSASVEDMSPSPDPDEGAARPAPSGISALNPGYAHLAQAPIGQHATFVATGLGRSGTTMIARILLELGIPMGTALGQQTAEDKEFIATLKANDTERFRALCRVRDESYDRWGFKAPVVRSRLEWVLPETRSPRLVIVFRDILAIALRNNITYGGDIALDLKRGVKGYQNLVDTVLRLNVPTLLISYEKALMAPEECISAVASFTGKEISDDERRDIARETIRASDPRYL